MKTSERAKIVIVAGFITMLSAASPSRAASFLQLSDIENVSIVHECSSCLYARCFRLISAQGSTPYWGHIFDRENKFYDKQSGSGQVKIESFVYSGCIMRAGGRRCGELPGLTEYFIDPGCSAQTGDNLFITYDGGLKKHIYLPPLGAFTELYVSSDGSTYYDSWLTQTAQEALPPTPTPTVTPGGVQTPLPAPTGTPTPEGFCTPSPRPICYCCETVSPSSITLSLQNPSDWIFYDSIYECVPDPAHLLDWWTNDTDWIVVTPARGFGIDGEIFHINIALGDTSSLLPGWHSEIVYLHDGCDSNVHVDYYKAAPSPTPSPPPSTSPTPSPSVTPTPCYPPSPSPNPSFTPTRTVTPTPSPTPTRVFALIDSGDYNSDGTSDIAILRESTRMLAVRNIARFYLPSMFDYFLLGDYNGDGTNDIGYFSSSSGLWSIQNVGTDFFGQPRDVPVIGDYNGDGTCDIAIFRGNSGMWSVRGVTRVYFGSSADFLVPGYYDGDGTKDIAIFRGSSGMWSIRNITRFYFGAATDDLVPGDYNADGAWEAGIFRASSGLWSIRNITRIYFGGSLDLPQPAAFNGGIGDDMGIYRESSGLWSVRNLTRVYFGASGDIPVTR